jgi:hypothetical protein
VNGYPLALTIGGADTWSGNPRFELPIAKYRPAEGKAPAKMFVGMSFLGQELDNSRNEPLVFSAQGGEVSLGQGVNFICFLFGAGKAMREKHTPDSYTIKVALFEADPDSKPGTYKYGRQVSNPIILKPVVE